ncbi:hypothetical protein [Methanolapillus ohkumae]|uniref:Uncharacterized protein n=1 Tax=Methanolapillus ohkumae TaxID=3028298 RepID=A0AA96V4K1_9EURY|nr:hypothetical protein MsAm2_02310 [Methanosarcinaceae archaeon Am2]
MTIGFHFQSNPCSPESVFNNFSLLKKIAKKHGVDFYDETDWKNILSTENPGENPKNAEIFASVHFFKTANIFFWYEDGCLIGDCQTNIAGAGFHAAAIEWMDDFLKKTELDITIEDEADYYSRRDFERMRQECFYPWLDNLVQGIFEQFQGGDTVSDAGGDTVGNVFVGWGLKNYEPADIPKTVVTTMGRFSLQNMLKGAENIEEFANNFFIWNNPKKDAFFYRNLAVSHLWEDCRFMPKDRSDNDKKINEEILSLLDKAVALDKTIPIPISEYKELCALMDKKKRLTFSPVNYTSEFQIGFRREMIHWRLGYLLLSFPGHYLFTQERGEQDHIYYDDASENWFTYRMTALVGHSQEKFDEDLFESAVEPPETFLIQNGKVKAAFVGKIPEEKGGYYQIVAEILSDKQVTLVTVYWDNPDNKKEVMDRLRQIRAVTLEDD